MLNLCDFKDQSIDRVIATCLISHLKDPGHITRVKRVLTEKG